MQRNLPPDAEVEGWLNTLSVTSICQWDVLVFLSRHQTTLLGAASLSRLLGYATESVIAALDVLASLALLERSRVSQGARLYQFTIPPGSLHHETFAQLQALGGYRAGRLHIIKQLQREGRTPGRRCRQSMSPSKEPRRVSGWHGSKTANVRKGGTDG
jgi:hypothetical protein